MLVQGPHVSCLPAQRELTALPRCHRLQYSVSVVGYLSGTASTTSNAMTFVTPAAT